MARELTLEIVTPEKIAFTGVVEEVTIPGTEGEFGVLKGHASLLSSVDIGKLSFTKDHKKTYYAVNTGYAEVTASKVTVLVETAERADLIDPERAKRARERAEEKIRKLPKQDMEFEKARLALLRAVTRINIAGKT
ncbi:MAG: ATP synthase F1 subunit epsilon [Syntrophobacterales bacterium CG_4_8_14_3_um_filter_58_8]|nr:MAG: ATP synthase F1 subunit epsilon [Syntrophaceae bacterium CG2_30_58_14]PIV06116.1 MAG: ATP synthase F1 subunit epsilon [Syntrophobacterales bacterium CG03_land_8_20_14_0_80_58_14]PJC73374.1 MAG: ATP synthase F1 subunit epsilon [Syntrophobacterales bacterium CG_4_8_14_3_um_filter_58_8]